jgi:hypothetical protein
MFACPGEVQPYAERITAVIIAKPEVKIRILIMTKNFIEFNQLLNPIAPERES